MTSGPDPAVPENSRHDLAEPQGDDGQVVSAKPERGRAKESACACGHEHADEQRKPERHVERVLYWGHAQVVRGDERVGVRPDREEGRVTEVEQAGETDDDVETDRHQHVDAAVCGEAHEVIPAAAGGELDYSREEQRDHRHEEVGDGVWIAHVGPDEVPHADHFSGTRIPSSPVGLNTRTKIRIAKIKTCVHATEK